MQQPLLLMQAPSLPSFFPPLLILQTTATPPVHLQWGHAFLPVVLPGTSATSGGNVTSSKLGAAVDWSHFHSTSPINMPPAPAAPRASPKAQVSAGG